MNSMDTIANKTWAPMMQYFILHFNLCADAMVNAL